MILRSIILFMLSTGTMLLCWMSPLPKGGNDAGVLLTLPPRVAMLQGFPQKPAKVEVELLPGDTEFAKMTYVTAVDKPEERDVAHVSIVLCGAESRSIHRPEVCLTGQGWMITGATTMPVEIMPGRTLMVRDLAIEGTFASKKTGKPERVRAHYVYWFVGADFNTASHFERLWRSTWDAVVHNVNHRWAYVSVMANVTEDLEPAIWGERHRTDEQTKSLISFLIQKLVPQFQKDFIASAQSKS